MKRFWYFAGVAVIAGFLLSVLVWIIFSGLRYPPREQWSSLWSAGTISNQSANDIWIEYGAVSGQVVAIYRDYDGDGFIDECLMLSVQHATLFRASNNYGLLNTMRDIHQSPDSAVRLPPGSPEAGPFTRTRLDELVRTHPRDVPCQK